LVFPLLYHDPSNLKRYGSRFEWKIAPWITLMSSFSNGFLSSFFSNSFCSFLPLEIESSHARVKVLQGFRHVIVWDYCAFSLGVYTKN
jgi:hypothetical protein